jgi:hypothetical protein
MKPDEAAAIVDSAIRLELERINGPTPMKEIEQRALKSIVATLSHDEVLDFVAACWEHLILTGVESLGDLIATANACRP